MQQLFITLSSAHHQRGLTTRRLYLPCILFSVKKLIEKDSEIGEEKYYRARVSGIGHIKFVHTTDSICGFSVVRSGRAFEGTSILPTLALVLIVLYRVLEEIEDIFVLSPPLRSLSSDRKWQNEQAKSDSSTRWRCWQG